MNVTVWNEHVHEREGGEAARIYPDGIHATIAAFLSEPGPVRTATLAEPEHALPPAVLDATDVLLRWGHATDDQVSDAVVEQVVARVWGGMGLVVLHSGHYSKPFKRLMATPCDLQWRHDERETVCTVAPGHPIAAGSSPSAPATRPTRSTTGPRSSACWSTGRAGLARQRDRVPAGETADGGA